MEQKQTLKEEAEWIDADHADLVVTDVIPVLDGKKQIGETESRSVVRGAKYEDLKFNYDLKVDMLNKSKNKLNDLVSQKEALGKKPVRTTEIIRVENALKAIQLIDKHNELEGQIAEAQTVVEKNQHFVDVRAITLAKRPEPKKD